MKFASCKSIPQLDLWRLSGTEWLLALRRPEPVARPKPGKVVVLAEQLMLPEFGAPGFEWSRRKTLNDANDAIL
ncbi:MAG TPA: hypothetical protein VFV38_02390 [Ktedonobacteraceae bacterium]|nr:hypothetical protein [Ktedonobacteraceae bacterium]